MKEVVNAVVRSVVGGHFFCCDHAAPRCLYPRVASPSATGSRPAKVVDADEQGARIVSNPSAPVLPRAIRQVRRALTTAAAEDVFLYSATLAFYGLICVAPLVVVALWVTSLVVGPSQIDDAAAELARFSPEDSAPTGRSSGWPILGTRLPSGEGDCRRVASDRLRVCAGTRLDRLAGSHDARRTWHATDAALLLECFTHRARTGQPRRELCRCHHTRRHARGDRRWAHGCPRVRLRRHLLDRRLHLQGSPPHASRLALDDAPAGAHCSGQHFGAVGHVCGVPEVRAQKSSVGTRGIPLRRSCCSGLWLFAANTALLVGYRAAHLHEPP